MDFNVNSPFAGMPNRLFSPQSTASATSAALGDLSRAFNMSTMAKAQPLNRGLSQNVAAIRRGQGTYDAQRQFAPLSQAFQDSNANAQWGLGVNRANEQAGLQGLGNLMNQQVSDQQRNLVNQQDQFALLSRIFNMSDLFGI